MQWFSLTIEKRNVTRSGASLQEATQALLKFLNEHSLSGENFKILSSNGTGTGSWVIKTIYRAEAKLKTPRGASEE